MPGLCARGTGHVEWPRRSAISPHSAPPRATCARLTPAQPQEVLLRVLRLYWYANRDIPGIFTRDTRVHLVADNHTVAILDRASSGRRQPVHNKRRPLVHAFTVHPSRSIEIIAAWSATATSPAASGPRSAS